MINAQTKIALEKDPIQQQAAEHDDLFSSFSRFFGELTATTPHLVEQAYRVRYQVYCLEKRFEKPVPGHPGLEFDAYDEHSVHGVLFHRPSCAPVGAVRMILPAAEAGERMFPMQNVCNAPEVAELLGSGDKRIAEISRFSITREFRRWSKDRRYPQVGEEDMRDLLFAHERTLWPYAALGLVRSLIRMSAENRLTHWCVFVEHALLRLLERYGIHFTQVGPVVDFHGQRIPSMLNIRNMLERMQRERYDCWRYVTDGGTYYGKVMPIGA
jgi:N-acyl amino acid synthase of PEP-CTERM/exosortase system